MAFEGQQGILMGEPLAIVQNLDPRPSCIPDDNMDRRGARIERILDELLDDLCRSLHHLPCGNLVGQIGFQYVNF